MDMAGASWEVASSPVHQKYWKDEVFWRKTQSMGISMAKFGSLVVQAAHSPDFGDWATPFVNAPFPELKLTQWHGGVAHNTGERDEGVVGLTVSNLSEWHDQFFAILLLASYLDPELSLEKMSVSHGGADFDCPPR
jgi:hypothetical protein